MKNFENILSKSDLFRGVDDDLEKIISCLNGAVKKYESGEILIHTDSLVTSIGIVLSGGAHITKEDIEGNRIIIANIEEGEMFGEAIAGSKAKKSPVTVITATGCEVIYIDINRVIMTCGSACPFHTQLIKNLIEIISAKNLFLNSRIDVLTQKTLRDKLIAFLGAEMKKRGSSQFSVNFSREELADFLFANRSAVSRELSLMQAEGLIKFNKNKFKILYLG